jgi:hypothetical protein
MNAAKLDRSILDLDCQSLLLPASALKSIFAVITAVYIAVLLQS